PIMPSQRGVKGDGLAHCSHDHVLTQDLLKSSWRLRNISPGIPGRRNCLARGSISIRLLTSARSHQHNRARPGGETTATTHTSTTPFLWPTSLNFAADEFDPLAYALAATIGSKVRTTKRCPLVETNVVEVAVPPVSHVCQGKVSHAK